MNRSVDHFKIRSLTLGTLLLVLCTSCFEKAQRRGNGSGEGDPSNSLPAGVGGSAPGSGGLGGDGDLLGEPIVEIRSLITPDEGTYVRKLTIPKNYGGKLYISGLNFTTLKNRFIKVKFRFGKNREPIEINDVTIATAPGLTPSTNAELLVLDLRDRPFENIRLLYDLYDYKDYDWSIDSPIEDNRDRELFCRGLNLEDDPTYNGVTSTCSSAFDTCQYTYAKVMDKGLYDPDLGFNIINGLGLSPAIDLSGEGYYEDTQSNISTRCLPDEPNNASANFKIAEGLVDIQYNFPFATSSPFSASLTTPASGDYDFTGFLYQGPYLSMNTTQWQIIGPAVFGDKGLFHDDLAGVSANTNYGVQSKLFPIYGKLNLSSGIEYLKVDNIADTWTSTPTTRSVTTTTSSGDSDYVDGCQIRSQSFNSVTNEHVGSCNLSASIEIWSYEPNTDKETLIAGTTLGDGGKEVKLQLVRDAILIENDNILSSSFNACTNNSSCGSGECCFNGRCWDEALVSSCIDDSLFQGDKNVGEFCSSDFECNTLCCSPTTARCAIHDSTLADPVLCNKPIGRQCISSEWCAQIPVVEYILVLNGTNPDGTPDCRVQGYNRLRFGDCINGICVSPDLPPPPPTPPYDCSLAVPPPLE